MTAITTGIMGVEAVSGFVASALSPFADNSGFSVEVEVVLVSGMFFMVDVSSGAVSIVIVSVSLVGFGTFELRQRAERKGRNPQTGAEITIAAAATPAFKAGKSFKEAVN